MAPSARVKKAFIAMKAIGISQEKTKVALKKLLQVYDKKWELIEAENYRVLADAIFEYEETETSEKEKKSKNADQGEASEAAVCQDITVQDEPMQDEPPERPLKRLRLKHQGHGAGSNGQPSPLAICGALKTPKPEPGEQGTSTVKKKQPQMITLITPKDEPVTADVVSIEPLAVVLPEPLNEKTSSKPDNQGGSQDSQRSGAMVGVDEGTELVLTAQEKQLQEVDVSDRTSAKLNIATSTLGKVQLSMACGLVSKEHKMRMPDLEAVLKKVNDDCHKRYKITDPGFSLTKMMIQLCDGVEEPDQTADDSIDNNRLSTIPVCSSFDEESHDDVTVTNDKTLVNSSTPPLASTSPEICMQHESDVDVMNLKSIVVAHPYDTSDITMGREIIMVSLEKFDCEFLPTFHYISRNVVSDNADVKLSLAQFGDQDSCFSCRADCVSSSSSCNCARHNGGESPYTGDGLIKEQFLDECVSSVRNPQKHDFTYCKVCQLELLKNEDILDPCKGHLKRKFLKECYTKCGCSQNCGNRVVQGGLRCKLQVFWTPEGKGWGLRALENLPKGAFVCEFVGEILTIMELRKRCLSRSSDKHSYSLLLDSDWGSRALKEEEFLCLDATLYGNVARFINHRCTDANLIEIPVEVETPSRHYYHMALFTTRNVNAFEELTWDYGVDFDDSDGYMETFSCLCGSQFCRNMKRPRSHRSLSHIH